jgi:hypothetical protein
MKVTEGAQSYLKHLEAAGKSPSTCATTKRTLALLVAHLGADRETGEVVAKDLDLFFASEAATKLRGKPRAAASIAQLRGIVRAALAWWQQQSHTAQQKAIPAAPAPASAPAPATKPPQATRPSAPSPPPALALRAFAPARVVYLDLTFQGQPVRFAKSEIDRARLYGLRKLIALDAQGRECQHALLTRDGRHVLPTGSTADLYINECGDAIPRRELVAVHEACTPLSAGAPTVNGSQEVVGPLAANALLDHAAIRVYALHPVIVPARLAQALGAGAVFRVPYRSRPGAVETPAFLLAGEAGAFLILAEPHGFDFVSPDQPVLPVDDLDEDDIDAFAFPDNFGDNNDPA